MQEEMKENYVSQAKLAQLKDDRALKVISTIALVSIALSYRKVARTNVGALKAGQELVRLQTVMLEAHGISV